MAQLVKDDEKSNYASDELPLSFDGFGNLKDKSNGGILPIDGIKYYLVHCESGKYIKPQSGKSNVEDNELLVYHSGPPDISCEFIFENGKIKHYGSGLFFDEGYKMGFMLIFAATLHSSNNANKMNIKMISKDNRTYLQRDDGLYLRPRSKNGSSIDNPPDFTQSWFTEDLHPSYSIVCLPAEDNVKVLDIKFDTNKLNSLPNDNITAQTIVTNNTNTDQQMETTVQYNRETSNSFELKFEEKASFSISSTTEANFDVPGFGGVKTSITFQFGLEFGSSQTTTKTTTQGVSNSITVKPTVKAGAKLKVIVTTQRKSGNVPFVMYLESQSGVKFQRKGILKTEYFFDQSITYDAQFSKIWNLHN